MRVIQYPPLVPYAERYAGMDMEPLRIHLMVKDGSALAGYDRLKLDGLLAWCVVYEATEGAGVPNESVNCYIQPVPLRVSWRHALGMPLYACTPFATEGMSIGDQAYWHKRMQSGRWTGTQRGTFNPSPVKGRWMERRQPLPTVVCSEWIAECVGNAEEIARLLRFAATVGKKRHVGFGAVDRWRIEPASEFALVRDERLTRETPLDAAIALGIGLPSDDPAPVGWTPPYWLPSLFLPGWWAGTAVNSGE